LLFGSTSWQDPSVVDFRYAQFCPLARATEILGERWTLLVVRELLLGGQRFSDLLRRLPGVSSSVLTERLGRLEDRGIVERRELPPPAGSTVYELTELGGELRAAVVELVRFGARLLEAPRAGEHIEPDWLRLAGIAFARRRASAPRAFRVRVSGAPHDVEFFVRGGPEGTVVDDEACEVDASLRGDPLTLLALFSGRAAPEDLVGGGALQIEGETAAVADLPTLFDVPAPIPNDKESLS
jgi:DNA-binding HxlR family transcriptional regulator